MSIKVHFTRNFIYTATGNFDIRIALAFMQCLWLVLDDEK